MMHRIQFSDSDDIINICWDNVFKAVFTKNTPQSQGALRWFLSAMIKRELKVIAVTANEPPIDDLRDRQIRYDIRCKLDNGELANAEMTLNPKVFEPIRMEYYVSKLFVSQDIKGIDKTYKDLQHTYQISIVVNKPLFKDDELVHQFTYHDRERNTSLGGRTSIITLELSKIAKITGKPAAEMTGVERWAVFFRYCSDKTKRVLINELLDYEEGIAMAGEALLTVSKDEIEQAWLESRYKYELDLQSDLAEARREGREKGLEEGRDEGREEGREKGRAEGREESEQQRKALALKVQELEREKQALSEKLREYEQNPPLG
jgi:predicted transposase/invertase (TIGR01784 family)